METKQIQTNVFTDGLNTDLHPLTTPNTVLTDCINGTIITYNGNEYILQNDMGNYQLSKAKLPADYIPIGIKEYGNIVYIVSYNPLDKKCQIGSYPSPQTLFDNTPHGSKDNEQYHGIDIPTLDDEWEWSDKSAINKGITLRGQQYVTNVFFSKLKTETNITVLLPETGDIKNTFLNPGDKYYLQVDDQNQTWKFQRCEYYTLTESKEIIKIKNDLINADKNAFSGTFSNNVKWETPGWIGYKPILLEPESFDLYLTNLKIPSFTEQGDAEIEIQGQLIINSNIWEQYYKNIKVYFEILGNGTSIIEQPSSQYIECEDDIISYTNKNNILTYNYTVKIKDLMDSYSFVIRATPYVIDGYYGFIYDNLSTTYTIDSGVIQDINTIQCFDIYKYFINDSGVTINFSIECPISKLGALTCLYRIWAFNDGLQDVHEAIGLTSMDSLNMFGQNILSINWDGEFQKEEIYLFELAFGNWEKQENSTDLTFKIMYHNVQVLITSELLNDFYFTTNRFQELSLSEWTSNLSNHVNVIKTVDNLTVNGKIYDWCVNVKDTNKLLDKTFYETPSNNLGDITDDNSIGTTVKKIVDKTYIEEGNEYFGISNVAFGTLTYIMEQPKIFGNIGMWKNTEWKNTTVSDVTSIINESASTKSYLSKERVFNETINDTTAEIMYGRYRVKLFKSEKHTVNDGTRWYLYKNLIYGLPLFAKETDSYKWKWDVVPILQQKNLNQIDYDWTTERLETLQKNVSTQFANCSTGMWKIYQSSSYDDRTIGYFEQYKLEGFDVYKLTFNKDAKPDVTFNFNWPQATKFDNKLTSLKNNPWWGIPIYIETKITGVSAGLNEKTWIFPQNEKTNSHETGNCQNSVLLTIPCNNNTVRSLAVINFLSNTYCTGGRFNTDNGTFNSSWLISNNEILKQGITNLYSDQNKVQYTSQSIAMFLFALGIHLYGIYDVKKVNKIIPNDYETEYITEVSNVFTVSYTRHDTLNQILYKNVDLTKNWTAKSFQDCTDNIHKTICGENNYTTPYSIDLTSINLYESCIPVNKTVTTKLVPYSYTISELTYLDEWYNSFISQLSNAFKNVINNFITTDIDINKVHTDFSGSFNFKNTLETIANSLRFEYKDSAGKFYYNDLPEPTVGIRTADWHGDDFIRSLDWSNIINWDTLYTALKPEPYFEENELKNKNGDN